MTLLATAWIRCALRAASGRFGRTIACASLLAWCGHVLGQPVMVGPGSPMPPGYGYPNSGAAGGPNARMVGSGAMYMATANGNRIVYEGPVDTNGRLAFSPRSGVQLTVEMGGAWQYGYQKVLFIARLNRPARADRQLLIEFSAGDWGTRGKSVTLSQTIAVGKGEVEARAEALVPVYGTWQLCGWEVEVDRSPDDLLSTEHIDLQYNQTNTGIAALLATPALSEPELNAALSMVGNGACTLHTAKHDELPEQWLEYTPRDLVVMEGGDFAAFARQHPQRYEALLRWVRSGGNLWLLDCGNSWDDLPAVEAALSPRASGRPARRNDPPTGGDADKAIVARGWSFAPLGERSQEPVEGVLALAGYDMSDVDAKGPGSQAGDSAAGAMTAMLPSWARLKAQIPTSRDHFAVRGVGFGTVTAFRSFFPGKSNAADTVTAIQQSLLQPRLTWGTRHGNRPDVPGPEFNNWLVPGVGIAPVGVFQGLITLFVLVIGPLNYWWLKRNKKLPLLLLTVPFAGILATALLFAFGMFADGLETRLRARSFTLLDQVEGEAATWARLTYYSGITPGDGLAMPRDTAIYPIRPTWVIYPYGRSTTELKLRWDEQQHLVQGWLPSRTPTQYQTIAARESTKRLDVRPAQDGMQVDNRLGVDVTHLVVQGRDGTLYWGENLGAGARQTLKAADPLKVSGRLRQLFAGHMPEFPPGAERAMHRGNYYGLMLSRGIMEAQIEAINSPLINRWKDGSYMAVTKRCMDVSLGLDNVEEQASFHLIHGLW